MILADKLIRLRKKNGWSQEELAEKMNVSRQAVSKWESAQTIPDLEKILQLGTLFSVTTDYLLKDELEDEVFTDDRPSPIRRITLAQANAFLQLRESASIQIAVATFLCILSVLPLLLLGAATELSSFGLSENLAAAIGLIALFVIVSIAVMLYLSCGFKNAPYEFLEKEPFETEYGVKGLVKEKQTTYRPAYIRSNIVGTCLCILSPIALLIGVFIDNSFLTVVMLALTMLIAGIGVMFFILAGVRWASMQKLLKEGDFSEQEKRKNNVKGTISLVYWLIVIAIYLCWSFLTNDWHTSSWIVWPIAGVLFAGVMAICTLAIGREK